MCVWEVSSEQHRFSKNNHEERNFCEQKRSPNLGNMEYSTVLRDNVPNHLMRIGRPTMKIVTGTKLRSYAHCKAVKGRHARVTVRWGKLLRESWHWYKFALRTTKWAATRLALSLQITRDLDGVTKNWVSWILPLINRSAVAVLLKIDRLQICLAHWSNFLKT